MGYWWRFLLGMGVGFFFAGISSSICWIYVRRIRPEFGDNLHYFKQKIAKIKLKNFISERCTKFSS
jgi:hypothetical protein